MNNDDPQKIVESRLGSVAAMLFCKLSEQKLERVDAIVLLQGDQLDRAPAVQSLYEQGYAGKILITGNNLLVGHGKRLDENDFPLSVLVEYLVDHGVPHGVIMVEDQSLNSRDQAANIIRIAKEQGWSRLVVVVSSYHLLRAYFALVHQMEVQRWSGKIVMHGIKLPWDKPPAGRIKTALEMLAVEMEKIKTYARDLASIEEGMRAFQLFSQQP